MGNSFRPVVGASTVHAKKHLAVQGNFLNIEAMGSRLIGRLFDLILHRKDNLRFKADNETGVESDRTCTRILFIFVI